MWNSIVSVPDYCLFIYFPSYRLNTVYISICIVEDLVYCRYKIKTVFCNNFIRKYIYSFTDYKNRKWSWGSDWKFRHEGNCSASRGLPSDGIFNSNRTTITDSFSFCILFSRQVHLGLCMCCFLFPFYAIITTFFDQEVFGLAPLLYVDAERFGGNWDENYVKTSKMTAKRQNRHNDVMHESRLTPHPSC